MAEENASQTYNANATRKINAILTAARLNGLIDCIPMNAELYKGYALFDYSQRYTNVFGITDGKRIDKRFLAPTDCFRYLRMLIDDKLVIWDSTYD